MLLRKKEGQPGRAGQDKTSRRKLLSTPNIPEFTKNNNNTLGDPRHVLICWACHSTDRLTTYHGPGGKLAICAACKNGGIE